MAREKENLDLNTLLSGLGTLKTDNNVWSLVKLQKMLEYAVFVKFNCCQI